MKTEMEAARDAATPRIAEWMEARLCRKISCHQIAEESIRRAFDAGVDYARGSQWVAVKTADDLPTEFGKYIWQRRSGDVGEGIFHSKSDCDAIIENCVAWMPLPEPYTPGSGQEGE